MNSSFLPEREKLHLLKRFISRFLLYRLPKDLTEKMPSATNSPIFGRRSVAASTVAGGSGELGALTLVGKARHPLSVASMVRRFERDSSLDAPRTRGGGGVGAFKNSDPDISPSSRSSSQGFLHEEQQHQQQLQEQDSFEKDDEEGDDDNNNDENVVVDKVATTAAKATTTVSGKTVTGKRRSATTSTQGPSSASATRSSTRVSTTSFLASVARAEQQQPKKSLPVRGNFFSIEVISDKF